MDLINRVFHPYVDKFIVVFIDDILIYSKAREEHVEHLHTVLSTLVDHKLYTKFKKCEFWMEKVHFLGHVISKEGISVDPATVAVVVDWPRPPTTLRCEAFTGWLDIIAGL